MTSIIHGLRGRRRKDFRQTRRAVLREFPADLRYCVPALNRKEAVEAICELAAYSDRHECFPVAFNVKAYTARLDAETLWNLGYEDHFSRNKPVMDPGEMGVAFNYFRSLCIEQKEDIFGVACEQAFECSFGEYHPDLFPGLKLTLRGRLSGHLVIQEFMGEKLQGHSQQSLREMLLEKEGNEYNSGYVVDTEFVVRLYFLCVMLKRYATPENASREVEYQAAFYIWSNHFEEDEALVRATRFRILRDTITESDLRHDYYAPVVEMTEAQASDYFEPLMTLADAAGIKKQ